MDSSKKSEYIQVLLSLIPEAGESVGNVTLRDRLKKAVASQGDELTEQDYWLLRDSLIDEGLIEQGRGRGGSVHRVLAEPVATVGHPLVSVAAAEQRLHESTLYMPVHTAITTGYVKENRIKRFVTEITASQGRRVTGGKWTRPDLTVVAVRTYQFTPGKRLEVITFEVKPGLDTALEGVYEALAHSVFSHRAYLVVDFRGHPNPSEPDDERIVQECNRHGVGYITFTDPSDYDTYDIVVSASLREPDPYDVDTFIRAQISSENQDSLRDFLQ